MKKRIISLLLALIMALSLLPVSVLAADDHTGQVHVTVENTGPRPTAHPGRGCWWTSGSHFRMTPP